MLRGVQIRLLGELEVVRDGHRLPLPASKRSRALLGYLVATGRPHLRSHLCDPLWDSPDDPRAALDEPGATPSRHPPHFDAGPGGPTPGSTACGCANIGTRLVAVVLVLAGAAHSGSAAGRDARRSR
jgi:hypothetical protein